MKLHIFGAAGTGVTTLGAALETTLGIPYFDSDTYFWEPADPPFTVRRPAAARDAALTDEMRHHAHWILGGSVVGWGEQWQSTFDLVVFLWLPPALRLHRLRQREFERYGPVIFTDPARSQQFQAFMNWAAGYDDSSTGGSRTIANHTRWLLQLTCPVLELRGDLSIDQRLHTVQTALRKTGLI